MDDHLHLLIVEESLSDAESLANELKNAGHSIKLAYAKDLGGIESSTGEQAPDILIAGSGEGLPEAAAVIQLLGRMELEIPVIAIGDTASEEQVLDCLRAGVSALVSYDLPEHLHLAYRRATELVGLRKQLCAYNGRLTASEKRAHALIENSSDAIAYIHDGMHVYANRPYLDLFEVGTRDDIEGMPVLDMISESQRTLFRDYLINFDRQSESSNTLDIDCVSPRGETFNTSMEFMPATMDGESCIQIIIRVNSGDNSELQKKIRSLSRQDMLTGLWNRQYFMQMLDNQLEQAHDKGPQRALVYLTLDNFKIIREEVGIVASDMVLCDIGNLLRSEAGDQDMLSRFGEYTFVLLKSGTDMEALKDTCKKMLQDIASHTTDIDGRAYNMTASVGICEINRHTSDAQKVISHADMACEVARTSGGNQIHTHSTVVDDSIENDLDTNSDRIIRETIEQQRFYLVFQPIVSLKGNKSEQYEVLLRITDTDGNVILPGEFVSLAERTGLAGEIDRWVIDNAFAALQDYNQSRQATFFIKITAASLAEPGFTDWVGEKLAEHGLSGDMIVFEINERSAISNLLQATDFVGRLHDLGCRVALEHFGVAEQATQVMERVPADIFKIDGSLVSTMRSDKDIQAKVRLFAETAREKEIICIAEHVDDAGILALLWQYGIDAIQGYFVQEPDRELGYEFESEIV